MASPVKQAAPLQVSVVSSKHHDHDVFECPIEECVKTFGDASTLRKHQMTHGERNFACTFSGCEKRFLDNSKLKRH